MTARPGADFTPSRENARARPRGYADWRPHRKTRELLQRVEEIIFAYEDFLPLTVRQIFYRLVATHGYDKTEAAYKRLCEHLVRARRAKLIPFAAIRDDGVVTYSSKWHDGPEAFWDETGERIKTYRRDRQVGQRARVELWCEAAGMAPQLAQVADHYSVPVFSAGGFCSLTAIRSIAKRALDRDVPTVLLHVGDLDPSGESIFDALAADAVAFVRADRVIETLDIEAVRVALTADQVEEYGLETAPPKDTDSRARRWRGETCQLEALAPDLLAEIVREAIEDRLDLDLLARQIDAEDHDRIQLGRALPAEVGT